jgi:isocitrate lyase
MGKGSTQVQHLVQTEVPVRLLEEWLQIWAKLNRVPGPLRAQLRPHTAGSELLALNLLNPAGKKVAAIIFATIKDRRGQSILSIRDQETYDSTLRQKRLMTLLHLFLIHRYKAVSVHYVTPTDDNQKQSSRMSELGIFDKVHSEVGQIIVAPVNAERVASLLDPDRVGLENLIAKR